jgi:heat shock protein beta
LSFNLFEIYRESTADSSFVVAKDPRGNTLGRGTEITMYLKDDAVEFLKQDKLEELIQKYSEFITFPIKLYKKTTETVEVGEDDEEETTEGDAESTQEDIEMEEEEENGDDTSNKEKKTETVSFYHHYYHYNDCIKKPNSIFLPVL